MIDPRQLNDIVAAVLSDPRLCYAAVHSVPPDGRLQLECSDRGALDEMIARVGPGAGVEFRYLDGAAPGLPAGLVVSSSVADVRREPSHPSELVTQAICGDAVEPLKMEGEWYLARLADGYIGWMRSWHLAEVPRNEQALYRESARHRVASNHAEVVEAPENGALPVTDLVIGTNLKITNCGRRGWRAVVLPDGRSGFIPGRSVEPRPSGRRRSRERLAATGLRFLGIPYLWGGNTPKGFDCSGLIQRVFRLNGVELPRDSDLQSRVGRLRPAGRIDALETGDLLFFGTSEQSITHVAMALSDSLFLHAYGQVRVGSMDPSHRLYEPKLERIWLLSRDPISA